jgi:hypothetical protein
LFDPAAPEDSLLGDLVSLPVSVAVVVDNSGVEREASLWSGRSDAVTLPSLAAVGDEPSEVGLVESEAFSCSGVLSLGFATFSVLDPIMFSVFAMSGLNVVYYLPLEEIVKKEWKTLCALGSVRRFKREWN